LSDGGDAVLIQIFDVIDRECAIAGSELGAGDLAA